MIIHVIAEGYMETIAAARLIDFCGHTLGTVYDQRGCANIRKNAVKYHHLATGNSGVLVLTDFRDAGAVCVPAALQKYIWDNLPNPPRSFLCRFAVNELESWMLADSQGLAKFFGIAEARMPIQPENEALPKKNLVNLASVSPKIRICNGIAPPPGHKSSVGPGYTYLMREFINFFWNIEAAMRRAPSLEHCVRRLRELA